MDDLPILSMGPAGLPGVIDTFKTEGTSIRPWRVRLRTPSMRRPAQSRKGGTQEQRRGNRFLTKLDDPKDKRLTLCAFLVQELTPPLKEPNMIAGR